MVQDVRLGLDIEVEVVEVFLAWNNEETVKCGDDKIVENKRDAGERRDLAEFVGIVHFHLDIEVFDAVLWDGREEVERHLGHDVDAEEVDLVHRQFDVSDGGVEVECAVLQ